VKFWDTSAIMPLISREPLSDDARRFLEEDAGIVVWWTERIDTEKLQKVKQRFGSLVLRAAVSHEPFYRGKTHWLQRSVVVLQPRPQRYGIVCDRRTAGEYSKERVVLDGGPVGRAERTQQTLTERREEERVSRVEFEDNLLQRIRTRHTKTKVREELIEETATESLDT